MDEPLEVIVFCIDQEVGRYGAKIAGNDSTWGSGYSENEAVIAVLEANGKISVRRLEFK